MTKPARILAILAVTAAAIALPAASGHAAAAQSSAAASLSAGAALSPPAPSTAATASKRAAERRACGFVGGETYRHCSTRTRVLIDARNIWGTTYRNICVGPGDTHLGYLSRWVIAYAWYIGRRC